MTATLNPMPRLATARELFRAASASLARRNQYPDSLARFGDVETDRNLRARILRRLHNARLYVNRCTRDVATLAYHFAFYTVE